jgi:hypothetical protein
MKKVVSFENFIKISKKLKLMKLFLLNDDQKELFEYCQTPYKIKDSKVIQDFQNECQLENQSQINYKMLKYLKNLFEKFK